MRRERTESKQDCTHLVDSVEADNMPDRSATVETLMQRWMEAADHEMNTCETTSSSVCHVIDSGPWTVRTGPGVQPDRPDHH